LLVLEGTLIQVDKDERRGKRRLRSRQGVKNQISILDTLGTLNFRHFYYLAYPTALVSRITITLIWPGYVSSFSIFFAISLQSI